LTGRAGVPSAGGRDEGRIQLLEVGLDWPPETYLQRKLERLAAVGFEVTVTSPGSSGAPPQRLNGVRLVQTPSPDGPRAQRLRCALVDALWLVTTPARAGRLVRGMRHAAPRGTRERWRNAIRSLPLYLRLARLKPDIVHFEWEQTAVACQPLHAVWGCPLVLSSHGVLNHAAHRPLNGRWLPRLPMILRRAALVCCASERLRSRAIAHGADPEKAVIVHSAVDPDEFRPLRRVHARRAELRVIAVGTLRWMKGYEYLLSAVSRLVERGIGVRVDILGGDPPAGMREPGQMRRMEMTVEDLGLSGRVHLHGKVSSAEVRRLLQRADVFVNSSVSEGLPTAMLEAMACGLPAVVSDCGDVREAVRDGVEGVIFAPHDTEAMVEALATLSSDPTLRAAMGAAGRARVQEEFGLQQQVERFTILYNRVLKTAAPGA
jgi:colanic acid/amylovoran biosynthesis glycosyltransferase